jgi:hypothetical protein
LDQLPLMKACDLIVMSSLSDGILMSQIPGDANFAYVMTNDRLFYVNKRMNHVKDLLRDAHSVIKKMQPKYFTLPVTNDSIRLTPISLAHLENRLLIALQLTVLETPSG